MASNHDPRCTGEYVRQIPGGTDTGELTLVGVVHNHPASKYRVRQTIEDADPAVLALELPPLAVPLYDVYADSDETPPVSGGEMSTAIQAASTGRVVGIDGPSPAFVRRLLWKLTDSDATGDVSSAFRSLATVTKRSLSCRLAAVLARWTGVHLEVDSPEQHDCAWTDDPTTQATDEQSQVRRARTITETFEQPDTVRVRKETRDQHMVSRLSTLRQEGDTVAVVGIAHLEPMAELLSE